MRWGGSVGGRCDGVRGCGDEGGFGWRGFALRVSRRFGEGLKAKLRGLGEGLELHEYMRLRLRLWFFVQYPELSNQVYFNLLSTSVLHIRLIRSPRQTHSTNYLRLIHPLISRFTIFWTVNKTSTALNLHESSLYSTPRRSLVSKMTIIDPYKTPRDPRWRRKNTTCGAPALLVPITLLLPIIWILFIAAQAYSRVLWDTYQRDRAQWDTDYKAGIRYPSPPGPPVNWGSYDSPIGYSDGISQFSFGAFLALVPETIHLPLHHYIYRRGRMHPIAGLVLSICFGCMWFISGIFGVIFQLLNEYYDRDSNKYDELMVANGALSVVMAVCWWTYMVFAAMAVHRWRAGRRNGEAYEQGLKDGMELGAVGRRSVGEERAV